MMPLSDQRPLLVANRQPFQAVGVMLILLFAPANLPWTLCDYDKAKHGFVSYQILEQHRWVFRTTSHCRYEVVRAPDEEILLYLGRPRILTFDRAAKLWRAGTIDGLVLGASDRLQLAQLPEMELLPRLSAIQDNDSGTKYIFVTRKVSRPLAVPYSQLYQQ
jgi:hypothetical protein